MDACHLARALRRLLPLLAAAIAALALACVAPSTPTGQAPGLPAVGVYGDAAPSSGPLDPPARSFPPPPDRDLLQLATQLALPPGSPQIPRVVHPEPVEHQPGRQDTFWLVDFDNLTTYQSEFQLRLVSPGAYWYVEKGLEVDQADLEESAAEFERHIYPRVSRVFGREWSPGVDNDPHLNIIHARLRGVLGYFSSADEHSRMVYPFSNQREAIYLNGALAPPGSAAHSKVLAHELQHLIHWNGDASEETWVNEGLSELSASVAGYARNSIRQYLDWPAVSLVHWPLGLQNVGSNYGGASLFMHYLAEHYGPLEELGRLVQEPADGIAGIDAYLEAAGYSASFQDVFRDWVVANLLDEAQGLYGYRDLTVRARALKRIHDFTEFRSEIPQYAPEYLDLTSLSGPLRLRFQGLAENRLLPLMVGWAGSTEHEAGSRCWWSNSGDSISSTLGRAVDLRGLSRATLAYQVWYDLEEDWDYVYLEVSLDRGRTWQILLTPDASQRNPIGNSFGPGYTGGSGGWLDQRVDLAPYAGQRVLLRFHYVTDDAVNGAGLCLRRISVAEAGLADDDLAWQPDGFILTDNRVKQDYTVQVVQMGPENRVTPLALNGDNAGELLVPNVPATERLVVVVTAQAPRTRLPAPYTLTVEAAAPGTQEAKP